MNILMIGTTDGRGGAAKVSQQIRKQLEDWGHSVSMFVADKLLDDPKIKIIPRQKWRKILGFLLGTEDLISTDWILDTPEFKNADVIHCHNLHGRFFNLDTLRKMSQIKPVVWTLHDEWAITPHCALTMQTGKMSNGLYVCESIDIPPRLFWDNNKRLAIYKNNIYRNCHFDIVTPSIWLRDRVLNTILSKQNIHYIPNGIDTSIFVPLNKKTVRQKLGLPLNKKIILFLADGVKENIWKGWEYVEDIIKLNKDRDDIVFLSVGNNNEEKSTNNIFYYKYTKNESEVSMYYSAADVLLFTSIAENFPLVVLEAMSCGLPIVSFDTGGIKEAVIHKKNGYIAKYKDVQDVNDGLNFILKNSEEKRSRMSNINRERILHNFTVEDMVKKYLSLYQKIVK
ncbi:MAG: hypothetical protein CO137_02315 [Candidatus Magasanikbacteria bacterium CG_4_9_14_3_um_filter_32_9]|uniref:Uncharacterized protein n=1 Tax=Candidatus Magasanikbacteria bacterium CG_4_9_14_3_um_filter_32_9 TaxID=1974644 RepID=A0A2M7Z6N1_9BACT|nr:MAG: hypothetical protein CO137_02315 [Candidatus Magasanikbacteria bacterium CG_4_9_14_3_um_filter_32_9]